MAADCSTCQHIRQGEEAGKTFHECRGYIPSIGEMRPDGTNAVWPRISPKNSACAVWLHRLQPEILTIENG